MATALKDSARYFQPILVVVFMQQVFEIECPYFGTDAGSRFARDLRRLRNGPRPRRERRKEHSPLWANSAC
jgi:hypothetical protein